jgi:hypothetical protein
MRAVYNAAIAASTRTPLIQVIPESKYAETRKKKEKRWL